MNSLNDTLNPFDRWHLEKYGYVPRETNGLYNEDDYKKDNISSAEEAFIFNKETP